MIVSNRKIAVIDKGYKEARAVLKQIENDYTIKYFQSVEEFYKMLDDPKARGEKEEPKEGEGSGLREYDAELSLFNPIDVVIVEVEGLGDHPKRWLSTCAEKIKQKGFSPADAPTKFVLTSFENESLNLAKISHPLLYDVLYKPYDGPLLLQKIELIAQLPSLTSPGHLYSHKTDQILEMSKESGLLKISEYGVTTLSPTPVPDGTYANFRLRLPGQRGALRFIGRSYLSEPADIPNHHQSSFTFFGLSSDQLRALRLFLKSPTVIEQQVDRNDDLGDQDIKKLTAKVQQLKKTIGDLEKDTSLEGQKKLAANKVKLQEAQDRIKTQVEQLQSKPKNVVVIDMDRDNLDVVKGAIEQNYNKLSVYTYPTYIYFLRNEIEPRGGATPEPKPAAPSDAKKPAEKGKPGDKPTDKPGEWTAPAFSFGNQVVFNLDLNDNSLTDIDPSPKEADTICGHPVAEFKNNPLFWKNLIHEDFREQMEDLITLVKTGQKASVDYQLTSRSGAARWFEINALPIPDKGGLIQLIINDRSDRNDSLNLKKEAFKEGKKAPLSSVDMLIINGGYIAGDINQWLEGLHQMLFKAKLIGRGQIVPVVIMATEDSNVQPDKFCKRGVGDFLYKPVDRRLLVQKIAIKLGSPSNEFEAGFMYRSTYKSTIEVGRPIDMEQVAEYGIIVRNNKAMHPGTILNFHSGMLTDSTGLGTLARCYGFEEHPHKEGQFRLHFLFYGIQDSSLKRIRQWIREEYVQAKGKR